MIYRELTDKDVIANRDDVEMIKRTHLWSAGGGHLLPLKHHERMRKDFSDETAFGVLFNSERFRFTVFLTNLFCLDLENCKRVEYISAEAIVADGWVVD